MLLLDSRESERHFLILVLVFQTNFVIQQIKNSEYVYQNHEYLFICKYIASPSPFAFIYCNRTVLILRYFFVEIACISVVQNETTKAL